MSLCTWSWTNDKVQLFSFGSDPHPTALRLRMPRCSPYGAWASSESSWKWSSKPNQWLPNPMICCWSISFLQKKSHEFRYKFGNPSMFRRFSTTHAPRIDTAWRTWDMPYHKTSARRRVANVVRLKIPECCWCLLCFWCICVLCVLIHIHINFHTHIIYVYIYIYMYVWV